MPYRRLTCSRRVSDCRRARTTTSEALIEKGQLELLERAQLEQRTARAVVVGLEAVGKSTVVTALLQATTSPLDLNMMQPAYTPTVGCNKRCLYRDAVSGQWTPEAGHHAPFALELLDIGGGATLRPFWAQLARDADAIIVVVDGREQDEAR